MNTSIKTNKRAPKEVGRSHDTIQNVLLTRHSEVDHLLDGFKALPLIRNVEGFEYMREGRVITTHPGDRSLQVQEALLLHTRQGQKMYTVRH